MMERYYVGYEDRDGNLVPVHLNAIALWVPVNIATGEVDVIESWQKGECFRALAPFWEWRRLTIHLSEIEGD